MNNLMSFLARPLVFLRGMLPIWPPLMGWCFLNAYVAVSKTFTTNSYLGDLPLTGQGWLWLAGAAVSTLLTLCALAALRMGPAFANKLPLAEFRDRLGLVFYFIFVFYIGMYMLLMLVGIGHFYVVVLEGLFALSLSPFVIALIHTAAQRARPDENQNSR